MAGRSPRGLRSTRHQRCDAHRDARRRRHTAHRRRRHFRPHRRASLGQVRGHEPDRVVQGSRHDDGHLEGRRARSQGGHLRLYRQHFGLRGRLRRQSRHPGRRARARGQDRDGQAQPGRRAQRAAAAGARQLRRLPRDRPRARRAVPGAPRELRQQRPHRGSEDRGVRGRRGARRRPRLPLHPGRQCRQLHRLCPRLRGGVGARRHQSTPPDVRIPGRRQRPDRARRDRQGPGDDRERDPDRAPGLVGTRAGRAGARGR